jgi:phage terminase Nu1 subunit (DNA packaging protein)
VAIAWLIKRAAEEAKGGDLNEARERARKTRAEADMKEMDREERRRSLVPAKISTEYIEAFVGGLASVAAGQLGRFERDIVKAETPAEARAVRMNIHRALMEGAQRYADDLAQRAEALELELSGEAIDAPAA